MYVCMYVCIYVYMVRLWFGSLFVIDPLSYGSFQQQFEYKKGRGMLYPVSGMVHIKYGSIVMGKFMN